MSVWLRDCYLDVDFHCDSYATHPFDRMRMLFVRRLYFSRSCRFCRFRYLLFRWQFIYFYVRHDERMFIIWRIDIRKRSKSHTTHSLHIVKFFFIRYSSSMLFYSKRTQSSYSQSFNLLQLHSICYFFPIFA